MGRCVLPGAARWPTGTDQAPGRRDDSRVPSSSPGDTNDRSLVTVFVEGGPVHLEKRADPLKAPLDRTIEIAHRDIDQARGELGEHALESQALIE